MDETEIDLSTLSISEACLWLLASLNVSDFEQYAYMIPYSSYVMTWPRAVPLDSILILQSPYPNNIFPPIAAAMSYDSNLCRKEMKGKELPPTVEVLANDLYINAGMEKQDSINILKNGWALVDKGILMFNEAVFHLYNPEEAYLESVKQCSVIIRLLQETEKYGKRTVNIYAFGESGERVGSNLCSWFKSPIVKLSKRKVTHPAGIARRYSNLNDPDCHMGTSSFSKALAKTFSNHVAFMYTMGKKSDQEIRSERLLSTFVNIKDHFPKLEEVIQQFVSLQLELANMTDDTEYKRVLTKLSATADTFAARLRIATSLVSGVQSYGSSVAANTSRPGASTLKTDRPSDSKLSEHIGRDSNPGNPMPGDRVTFKSKTRTASNTLRSESFSNISHAPSIASITSEVTTPPMPSSPLVNKDKTTSIFKAKTVRNTPLKQVPNKDSSSNIIKDISKDTDSTKADSEQDDVVSPLAKKFMKKVIVPKSRNKVLKPQSTNDSDDDIGVDVKMNDVQSKMLSSIEGIVTIHNPSALEDSDYENDFDNIALDIKNKMADNSITKRFIKAINTDINTDPKFDINKWMSNTTDTCATFELCKKEFNF